MVPRVLFTITKKGITYKKMWFSKNFSPEAPNRQHIDILLKICITAKRLYKIYAAPILELNPILYIEINLSVNICRKIRRTVVANFILMKKMV